MSRFMAAAMMVSCCGVATLLWHPAGRVLDTGLSLRHGGSGRTVVTVSTSLPHSYISAGFTHRWAVSTPMARKEDDGRYSIFHGEGASHAQNLTQSLA